MSGKGTGEREIWDKIKNGDHTAKEQYLCSNFNLVHSICSKFMSSFYASEYDDIFQEGCIGLYKAIDKYQPCYGTKFSSFAVPFIIGEIKYYLKKQSKVRFGMAGKKIFIIKKFREEYLQEHGKEPPLSIIASKTGISEEEVIQIIESFPAPFFIDNQTEASLVYNNKLISMNTNLLLKEIISSLPPRERKIIFLRYFQGLKQEKVAEVLSISQKHVSRLETKIKQKLRDYLQD